MSTRNVAALSSAAIALATALAAAAPGAGPALKELSAAAGTEEAAQTAAVDNASSPSSQASCERTYEGGNFEDPRSAGDDCRIAADLITRRLGYTIAAARAAGGEASNHEPFAYCRLRYRMAPKECADASRTLSDEESVAAVSAKIETLGYDWKGHTAALARVGVEAPLKLVWIGRDLLFAPLADGGWLIVESLGSYGAERRDYFRLNRDRRLAAYAHEEISYASAEAAPKISGPDASVPERAARLPATALRAMRESIAKGFVD